MDKEEKRPEIDMLSQPLLTEEGFVNPACMNELETVIKNIPKTHERKDDDEEWTKKRYTNKKEITSGLAKNAVSQSPYACPYGLEGVVKYLDECLTKSVEWDQWGFTCLSLIDISKLLYDILYDQGFILFDNWNKPKRGDEAIVFFSRDSVPRDADYDFIDLDALLHNVCIDIRNERREFDRFNKKFDEEHPEFAEES